MGEDELQAQPRQVGGAGVLHALEEQRVGGQQRRHTGHGQPQQHLVTHDQAQRGCGTAAQAALGGGREQSEGAWARQRQEEQDRSAVGAKVRNTKKHGAEAGRP